MSRYSRHIAKLVNYFTSTERRVADRTDDQPLRREGVDSMDWRHIAACREVLDECLRWAIDSGQDAGVWGGMSEDERRALKRRTLRLRARAGVSPALASNRQVKAFRSRGAVAPRTMNGNRIASGS